MGPQCYNPRMIAQNHEPALDRVRALLEAQPDIQVAIVFGSVALGTAGPHSDFDIGVLAERPLDASRKSGLVQAIADITGRPVDLIDLRTAGVMVLRSVFGTGRRLICRDRRAYDQLLTRMLTDAEDFLPYRQRMLRERRDAWIH